MRSLCPLETLMMHPSVSEFVFVKNSSGNIQLRRYLPLEKMYQ